MPCLRMSVNRLREGMMIKEDVFSKTGAVIVPDGAVVTKDVVALLTRHFVDSVMVEYPTGRKERPEQQEQSAPAKEQHLKEFQAEFSVAEQSISEELKDIVYRSKDVNISMLLEPLNGLLKKADDDTDLSHTKSVRISPSLPTSCDSSDRIHSPVTTTHCDMQKIWQ